MQSVLLSNLIAGFFDYQCLWKETILVLELLHEDSNQGKVACKTNTADWVWPCMYSHAHVCLHLPGVNLVWLGLVWLH